MKTAILAFITLFAITATGDAETLKWTYTHTAPTAFETDSAGVMTSSADIAGNICVVIGYSKEVRYVGYRILWISSRGKIIHSTDIPVGSEIVDPKILRVNGTHLLVTWKTSQNTGPHLIRTYRARGTSVTASDLLLPANAEFPGGEFQNEIKDIAGFFVFGQSQSGEIQTIKRYSLK